MDSTQNSSKKQRNPKSQRERRRPQEKELETSTPPALSENSAYQPQPQRANRRQRNEPPPKTNPPETPAPPAEVTEKKEKVENVVVDHSHLKRETEEIAKLTKKFTKREIASNWSRYSATESRNSAEPEEDGPADFSDLLQVPVSRGGHLQLKEEQDWSKATGAELSGYFALNLKLLNLSLSCIPAYERLNLPKDLFTEEEIRFFDNQANIIAKAQYNPEIEIEVEKNDLEETKAKDSFNILDVQGSTQKLLNLESDFSLDSSLDKITDTLEKEIDLNSNKGVTEPEFSENKKYTINLNSNAVPSLEKMDFSRESPPETKIKENSPVNDKLLHEKENMPGQEMNEHRIVKQTPQIKPEINNKIKETPKEIEEIITPKDDDLINDKSALTNETSNFVKETKIPFNDMKDQAKNGETNEKTSQRNKNNNKKNTPKEMESDKEKSPPNELLSNISDAHEKLKQPTIGLGIERLIENAKPPRNKKTSSEIFEKEKSPIQEVNSSKKSGKVKDVGLEDDDDLDFLLLLKKPVPSQMKEESKPGTIKESKFLPGKAVTSQTTTKPQHSELDDWLDSVLED